MPINPDIRARMVIFLSGRDREFWPRDLVTAAEEGHWTIEEALAYLHELNTRPVIEEASQPEAALSRPRPRRRALLWSGTAPAPEPSACYVPSISFAQVKRSLPICVQKPLAALWRAPVSSATAHSPGRPAAHHGSLPGTHPAARSAAAAPGVRRSPHRQSAAAWSAVAGGSGPGDTASAPGGADQGQNDRRCLPARTRGWSARRA